MSDIDARLRTVEEKQKRHGEMLQWLIDRFLGNKAKPPTEEAKQEQPAEAVPRRKGRAEWVYNAEEEATIRQLQRDFACQEVYYSGPLGW